MNTSYISLCFLLSLFAGIYASNIHLLPLQGNYSELFFYYTTIQVGTSPVSFTVIVDTGSSDLLLPSIDCTTCVGDITKFYCASCSSTSSVDTSFICTDNCTNGGCHFVDTYDGGLAESAVATQDVIILNDISTTVSFGDVYFIDMGNDTVQNIKNFQAVNDFYYPEGMWGLAYKSLSAFGAPTVIDSFVSANLMDDIFSLCLNDVGGMLVLGGIYPGYTNIIYTPIPYETFYTFQALDFTANGVSVAQDPSVFNPKVSIVDSGTPLPTVPTTVYTALKSLLLSNCSQNSLFGICSGVASENETLFDGLCFDLDSEQISLFPTFEFVMEGETQGSNISLSLPPQVYLQSQYFCNETSQIGLGLAADPEFTIIGAQMMQTLLTVFDRQNKRIGFAPKLKC